MQTCPIVENCINCRKTKETSIKKTQLHEHFTRLAIQAHCIINLIKRVYEGMHGWPIFALVYQPTI